MYQVREQNRTPENELNKMETSKLLDAEFKTLTIGCLIISRSFLRITHNTWSLSSNLYALLVLTLLRSCMSLGFPACKMG